MDDETQSATAEAPNAEEVRESASWEAATQDYLGDLGHEPEKQKKSDENEEGAEDESAKSKEGSEEGKKTEDNPEEKKPNEEQESGDDPEKKAPDVEEEPGNQPPAPDNVDADRNQRRVQLELDADRKEIAEDIRKELYSDVPTKLLDADGDPIETIQDVMRLQNPQTGKAFTAEEASQYLLQATRNLEKQQATTEKELEGIVDTNINLKEDADYVKDKYGELLSHMPKLRAQVWNLFQQTLVRDDKTDIIKKTPVSMKAFYDNFLTPYVKEVDRIKAEEKAAEEAAEKAKQEAEVKKKEVKEKRTNSQADREDIYSNNSKIGTMDPDEKEWADAAKELYEG